MQRRDFLRLGLGAALLPGLGAAARGQALPSPPAASLVPSAIESLGPERLLGRVVAAADLIPAGTTLVSNRDALPEERVRARLDAGLAALLGPDPWPQLAGPKDTVAIKVNGLGAPLLSPRPELVRAIVAGVRSAGVPADRVIVWDRSTRELERCGFPLQTAAGALRAYGTDALRGGGYTTELESYGAVGSFVTRIVAEYASVLINVGVLKDHDLAGVSAGMKNLYGAIHNPNRYHDHGCDPHVAHVAALPSLRRRLKLTVIDAVLGQAQGGPAYVANWIWPCDRILLACDPVACDTIAWDWIEKRRAVAGLPSLTEAQRAPSWIETAARLGLGRNRAVRIEEV
jgi:uncharacterized protein (DUF362 family)